MKVRQDSVLKSNLQGNPYGKFCALARSAGTRDLATQVLGNMIVYDVHSQSHAALSALGGKEWVIDLFYDFIRHTPAVVFVSQAKFF